MQLNVQYDIKSFMNMMEKRWEIHVFLESDSKNHVKDWH